MATRRGTSGSDDEGARGRTQRTPMLPDPSSLDVDVEVVDVGRRDEDVDATQPTMARPVVVVMEERPTGLADALARLGLLIRPAATGLQAISLVGERLPDAVLIGPGDTERRRVLTGTLRLRFPSVPVVLVLPRIDGDAAEIARQEGVRAVLPWPLPSASEVLRILPRAAATPSDRAPRTLLVPPVAALPPLPTEPSGARVPLLSADASATGSMIQPRPLDLPPPPTSPPPETTLTFVQPRPQSTPRKRAAPRRSRALEAPMPLSALGREAAEDDDALQTLPNRRPAADAQDAPAPPADANEVLRALTPFLRGLDECARFLEELSRHRVAGADDHARTVRLVTERIAQLQARVDDEAPR